MMGSRTLLVLAVALLGAACQARKAGVQELAEPSAAPAREGPCPSGPEQEPGPGELRPSLDAFRAKDYRSAQRLLGELAQKYPKSPAVALWQGEATLYEASTVAAAEAAEPHYLRARQLEQRGCSLEEADAYYLRLGLGNVSMRRAMPAAARPLFAEMVERWPQSAQSHYVSARALCALGELPACTEALETTFKVAKSHQRPRFLRTHYALEDWLRMSSTQSEFAELRLRPEYRRLVAEAKKE